MTFFPIERSLEELNILVDRSTLSKETPESDQIKVLIRRNVRKILDPGDSPFMISKNDLQRDCSLA